MSHHKLVCDRAEIVPQGTGQWRGARWWEAGRFRSLPAQNSHCPRKFDNGDFLAGGPSPARSRLEQGLIADRVELPSTPSRLMSPLAPPSLRGWPPHCASFVLSMRSAPGCNRRRGDRLSVVLQSRRPIQLVPAELTENLGRGGWQAREWTSRDGMAQLRIPKYELRAAVVEIDRFPRAARTKIALVRSHGLPQALGVMPMPDLVLDSYKDAATEHGKIFAKHRLWRLCPGSYIPGHPASARGPTATRADFRPSGGGTAEQWAGGPQRRGPPWRYARRFAGLWAAVSPNIPRSQGGGGVLAANPGCCRDFGRDSGATQAESRSRLYAKKRSGAPGRIRACAIPAPRLARALKNN